MSGLPPRRHRPIDFKQLGLEIAAPLSARLDALVDLAYDAGLRTSRTELINALVHGGPRSEPDRRAMLDAFWSAVGLDVVIDGHDPLAYLDPPKRAKGPRPIRATAPPASAASGEEITGRGAQPLRRMEKKRVGVSVHPRIDARLDELAQNTDTRDVTRTDVIGALILGAPDNPERLVKLLQDYRAALPSWQTDADRVGPRQRGGRSSR